MFISAIVLGINQGLLELKKARVNNVGVKSSDNIFKFFFWDKY